MDWWFVPVVFVFAIAAVYAIAVTVISGYVSLLAQAPLLVTVATVAGIYGFVKFCIWLPEP